MCEAGQRGGERSEVVSIRSGPFKPWEPLCNQGVVVLLHEPTADIRALINAALWGLSRIYRTGYAYKKAWVLLCGLEHIA